MSVYIQDEYGHEELWFDVHVMASWELRATHKMAACSGRGSRARGVLMLPCFIVVSFVLARVSSATAGGGCSTCTPIDGRCAPGFVTSDDGHCICDSKGNTLPIFKCNESSCRAYLRGGYWAGYVNDSRLGDAYDDGWLELYRGRCPRGFCTRGEYDRPLLLPGLNSSSNLTEELNEVVCGKTRRGVLCGECRPGYGPGVNLFLAPCVHCATDPLSQVGWLLWLLLEALPMMLMLAAFLIFDINLLAGPLNSYLLYAQFFAASFPISSVGPIVNNNRADSVIVRFLYVIFFGIFNLQFFSFLFPPFCISPGAANLDLLDMILIKALTRLLPFIVILAIIAMQWCNHYGYCWVPNCWQRLSHHFRFVRWLNTRMSGQSAAHGLSAMFILVYTRFLSYGGVLCDGSVIQPNSTSNAPDITVVELQGNLHFFHSLEHILVTAFILLLIVFMILLPTCLLLVYPALPQIQARMKISKYKVLRCICDLKCLNVLSSPRIQLFADLFQSSYKNNCRFFAGLLLLVRIVVVVTWNIGQSLEAVYTLMTALSIAVLALHSLFQPHRHGWINVVDSILYTHLAAVNLFGAYISSQTPGFIISSMTIWTILYQCALFVPALYLVFYVGLTLYQRYKRSCRRQQSTNLISNEAASDDVYLIVDNVVEVDPTVDGDPVRERWQGLERSYGSMSERNRHQELWFNND